MKRFAARKIFSGSVAVSCIAVLLVLSISPAPLWAQQGPPYPAPAPAPSYGTPLPASAEQSTPLTPDQLDNLVAPIALYPDPLLSQILAASTYPLEIVDAEQWLQQNRNLPAAQRMDAAKQQSWDPSVQALAAFPDVLDILGRDIRWTTDLGNAFLAQQADVMSAIQTMRARAQQSGQLRSTPQQTVTTETQDGQSAIQIAPADPQYVYPPVYDPYAVWGPPVYGAYPSLWYPPAWGYGGFGVGIGFAPGIFLGGLFSGLLGFGGWGWGLGWFAHSLFLNPLFFAHFGFHGYDHYGFRGGFGGGRAVWAHDPGHRMGVPYSNRQVASRFGGRVGGGVGTAGRSFARTEAPRTGGASSGWRGVGSGGTRSPSGNQFAARAAPQAPARQSFAQGNRAPSGGNRAPSGSYNGGGYNRVGPSQSFAARGGQAPARMQTPNRVQPQARQPQARAPQNAGRSFSAPRAPSASSHASAPHGGGSSHASVSHSGGGHSGGGGHSSGHRG